MRHPHTLSQFSRATIRAAGLRAAIELLRDLGHDPKPVVEASGVSLDLFRDPDSEAPLAATLKLLGECARVSGLPHFCLLAGARNGLSTLGVFGHLALTAPEVRTAIEDIIGSLSVFDRVASARLAVERDIAAVNYLFDFPSVPGAVDFCDGTTAAISRMLRGICGDEWKPLRVRLPRGRPVNAVPYYDLFGCDRGFRIHRIRCALAGADADRSQCNSARLPDGPRAPGGAKIGSRNRAGAPYHPHAARRRAAERR